MKLNGKSYFPKDLYFLDEKEFRKEVTKIVSVANKRIARLEKSKLTDSPAYRKLVDNGGIRFSVKGKTHNELQREVSRMKKFMESETSTVRGLNNSLKKMAAATGVKYKNLKDLQSKAKGFFELSSKVEQYLRNVNDMASAIGYQKIWTAVNQYVKTEKIDLADSGNNIDELSKILSELLADYQTGKLVEKDQLKIIAKEGAERIMADMLPNAKKENDWWFIE